MQNSFARKCVKLGCRISLPKESTTFNFYTFPFTRPCQWSKALRSSSAPNSDKHNSRRSMTCRRSPPTCSSRGSRRSRRSRSSRSSRPPTTRVETTSPPPPRDQKQEEADFLHCHPRRYAGALLKQKRLYLLSWKIGSFSHIFRLKYIVYKKWKYLLLPVTTFNNILWRDRRGGGAPT